MVDGYNKQLEDYSEQLEQAHNSENYYSIIRGIFPFHRTARNFLLVLSEALQYMPDSETLDQADSRMLEIQRNSEYLMEEAKLGMEYTMAQRMEHQTELSNQLAKSGDSFNLLAAIFLPITAIAAIFGMNFDHGIANKPVYFWVIIILGLILGVFTRILMTLKRRS